MGTIQGLRSSGQALKVSGREYYNDGLMQRLDGGCLTLGSKWKVEARMKLISHDSGDYVACLPSEKNTPNSCPAVHLSSIKNGNRVDDGRRFMTNTWTPSSFNLFETEFEISRNVAWGDDFFFGFRNFNTDWILIIDDITVTPLV